MSQSRTAIEQANLVSSQLPAVEARASGSLHRRPSEDPDQDLHERRFSAEFNAVVHRLRQKLPHLKHVLESSSYRVSQVSVYDYSSDMVCMRHLGNQQLDFADAEGAVEAHRFITSLRHSISDKCTSRLIIVEDVCLDLIHLLSVTFSLSPEICEEHLIRSGWTQHYRDSGSESWNSRRIAREHVSLRWHRPGRISLSNLEETPINLSPDQVLYQKTTKVLATDSKGTPTKFRDTEIYPDSNAWRSYLDFRPLSAGALRQHDLIAREERVTMWQRCEDDCLFGMMIHGSHISYQ